jgi:FtsP/CotA-like multicopper oxidase with cupredoxin domain
MPKGRLLAAAVGVLLVAGCGGSDDDAGSPSTPTPSAAGLPSATASPTPSTLPTGVDQVVTIRYAGGEVTGPKGRVKVARGDTVQLLVTSDKADEVHLHGYDKSVDVAAGATVRLTFKATIPGVFEVELEHRKVTLVRLQVQ